MTATFVESSCYSTLHPLVSNNMALLSSTALGQTGDTPFSRRWQRRAQWLEYLTLAWAGVELLGGIISGLSANSISLLSFGAQSGIEFILSGIILWRLSHQYSKCRQDSEAAALRWAGISFLAVATLTAFQAIDTLIARRAPSQTILGLLVTCAALIVMPAIAQGKRIAANRLDSQALRTDAQQNSFCAYQAAIVLVGLLVYRLLGWWWADPVAALILVPLMLAEGTGALRGRACGCAVHSSQHGHSAHRIPRNEFK